MSPWSAYTRNGEWGQGIGSPSRPQEPDEDYFFFPFHSPWRQGIADRSCCHLWEERTKAESRRASRKNSPAARPHGPCNYASRSQSVSNQYLAAVSTLHFHLRFLNDDESLFRTRSRTITEIYWRMGKRFDTAAVSEQMDSDGIVPEEAAYGVDSLMPGDANVADGRVGGRS